MDEATQRLLEISVEVINQKQAPTGAYMASPNFHAYRYCWFRDGAFIADAMSRAGEIESAERFFGWCATVLVDRRDRIRNGDHLDTRFSVEGHEVNAVWANYQLDGYGLWLWALRQHEERHNRSLEPYHEAIELTLEYLALHWQEDCFDWWEERLGRHAATLSSVYAGMAAFNHPDAPAVKAAIAPSVERTDASLLACGLFDAEDAAAFAPTLARIEHELVDTDGGVHRHPDDEYYGGGQWPVLAGLLGWYYLKIGRRGDAEAKLRWIVAHQQENGWLPEQLPEHMIRPDSYKGWIDWHGSSATPLLWSHAMFIILATQLQPATRPASKPRPSMARWTRWRRRSPR